MMDQSRAIIALSMMAAVGAAGMVAAPTPGHMTREAPPRRAQYNQAGATTMTRTMTRDEILAQAKVGDVVAVKMRIIEPARDNAFTCAIEERYGEILCIGRLLRVRAIDIVGFIERSPETDAEKIARLEARIAELEAGR